MEWTLRSTGRCRMIRFLMLCSNSESRRRRQRDPLRLSSRMHRGLLGFLLALSASVVSSAGASTVTVSIPVERDATVMAAHPRDNDGAWGYLWLKWNSVPLENRVLLGFDLSPLAGRAADVVSATVVLRAADHTFPTRGTRFGIHALKPGALDWEEGDLRFDLFSYCSRRDLHRAPTGEGGPGVTWSCESDSRDLGGTVSCVLPSPPEPWLGGSPSPADTPRPEPRGFRASAMDSRVESRGYDPRCRQALGCFESSSNVDCWRKVELDATSDVRRRLSSGEHRASWMLRKAGVGVGGVRFFSREGAICILGVPMLRPQLIVTLVERPGDPPRVPEPPDHCGAS